MITHTIPDKWVRKAVYDNVNGVTVNGEPIPVYDYRTGHNNPMAYILIAERNLMTQNKFSLCEDTDGTHTLNIECYTRKPSSGNPGSRLLVDDIAQAVLANIQNLQLDPASGLRLSDIT